MKIKINEFESYLIELPEEITQITFEGLFERFKAIKSIINKTDFSETKNELVKKGLEKGHRGPNGIVLPFIRNNRDEISRLFYNSSETNDKILKMLFENNKIPFNRGLISTNLSKVGMKRKDFEK